jgi:hypothetical protein
MEEEHKERLKHFAELGLHPFYAPEYDNYNREFMGYTPHLFVERGEEICGNPMETIEEAFNEALGFAAKIEKLIEESKPLVLF